MTCKEYQEEFDALQQRNTELANANVELIAEAGCAEQRALSAGVALDVALALLRKMRGWDHLEGSADGPFWRREIDRVLTDGEGDTVAKDD